MSLPPEALKKIKDLLSPSLQSLSECRKIAFNATINAPENAELATFRDHLQKAELSLLQARDSLFQLQKGKQKKK